MHSIVFSGGGGTMLCCRVACLRSSSDFPGIPLDAPLDKTDVLHLSTRTVREYLQRGEIEGRIIGGLWRFRRADLDGPIHSN
jgi:excisionase family DNA binding protein